MAETLDFKVIVCNNKNTLIWLILLAIKRNNLIIYNTFKRNHKGNYLKETAGSIIALRIVLKVALVFSKKTIKQN